MIRILVLCVLVLCGCSDGFVAREFDTTPVDDYQAELRERQAVLNQLERALRSRGAQRAGEIAYAIVKEGARTSLDPWLIAGVIQQENPWFKPDTINSYGAVGLMQVTGWLHLGEYPECGEDLTDINTNICYGTRILKQKLEWAGGELHAGLLKYNGCRKTEGNPQPRCLRYPRRVMDFAAEYRGD